MMEMFLHADTWAALAALIAIEVVLGIDNLIFISIITNQLPLERQASIRRMGIGLALILRLALLTTIATLVQLTAPLFDLGLVGPLNDYGAPSFETAFSLRDLIMIGGGFFLVWKSVTEIHHIVDPEPTVRIFETSRKSPGVASAIVQIILLDVVFSLDSILTAVGMTSHVPLMVIAVVIAVLVMLFAAERVARFIRRNPTVVMLALAFLLMIGLVLIADGFGHHIPKAYLYAAMFFGGVVEFLNMLARKRRSLHTPDLQAPH